MSLFTPLKRVAQIRYGLGQPPAFSVTGIPILRATNITKGKITKPGLLRAKLEDLPLERAPLLTVGEILVVRSGALTGDSARITEEWKGSAPGYDLRVTPKTADSRFLAYSLLSKPVLEQMQLVSSRAAQPHLNAEELGCVEVWLPSLREQRSIADFLDAQTTRIDYLINKRRHLLSLMTERIDSRILQFVGNSKLVKTANGTATLPIRRLLTKTARPPAANTGVITAYRDGQVTDRSLRRAEGYTLSASTDPQGQYVQVSDVVVHGLDGFAGAIGTAEAYGNCSPVYHVCVPTTDSDSRFLGRLLRILALQGYLGNFATSTRERAVDFRNWDLFGRIPIPVAPAAEQREIGDWITKLRPLREAIERSESLATEHSQALITAAVTGQFDVSTASGRNVTDGVQA
ncbi:restriction endonuclease subunit S [Streptomyces cyaneofuscatus]|uniref:restriction endonuclease subunit S n=1 Tax=Streptomyces cyaneofuscatus TaxID=66883 RepID=UPI00381637AE